MKFPSFSVIVPLAPQETAWCRLAGDLQKLPRGSEIIFAGPLPPKGLVDHAENLDGTRVRLSWVRTAAGRATQLNTAARAAKGTHLWFLHADSRLPDGTIAKLAERVVEAPDALHYFDLRFLADGPRWMRLNAIGTFVRSRVLGMPFGDQGFCLARDAFLALGGYDPEAPYGEDHLLVWHAARARVKLAPVKAALFTSARKYRERGWARTTAKHVLLTWKQALPQAVALWLRR